MNFAKCWNNSKKLVKSGVLPCTMLRLQACTLPPQILPWELLQVHDQEIIAVLVEEVTIGLVEEAEEGMIGMAIGEEGTVTVIEEVIIVIVVVILLDMSECSLAWIV